MTASLSAAAEQKQAQEHFGEPVCIA